MELWAPPGYCDFPPDGGFYEDEESWGTEPDDRARHLGKVYKHGRYKVIVRRK